MGKGKMEIGLLGPLVVEEQGTSIVPSAHKPRKVLALLALHADRIVTVPSLVEEIWGEAVPRSAATTLQTYILQLRAYRQGRRQRKPELAKNLPIPDSLASRGQP